MHRRILALLIAVVLLTAPIPAVAQSGLPYRQVATFGRGVIDQLYWSPDGTQIAAATIRGVYFYNAENLTVPPRLIEQDIRIPYSGRPFGAQPQTPFPGSRYYYMPRIAFDSIWQCMATAVHSGGIELFDVQTGQRVGGFNYANNRYLTMAFNPNGTVLAAARQTAVQDLPPESQIDLWDTVTSKLIRTVTVQDYQPRAMRYTPDGRYLVVSAALIGGDTGDQSLYVIDPTTGLRIFSTSLYQRSSGGNTLPAGVSIPSIVELNTYGGYAITFRPDVTPFSIQTLDEYDFLALSPDGTQAALYERGSVYVQTIQDGKKRGANVPALGKRYSLEAAFNPAGTQFVVSDEQGDLSIYAIEDEENVRGALSQGCPQYRPNCITYTDAHRLHVGEFTFNVSGGAPTFLKDPYTSPNGRWILSRIGTESEVQLTHVQSGKSYPLTLPDQERSTPVTVGTFQSALFSADGKTLIIAFGESMLGGYGNTLVRVWNISTDRPLLSDQVLMLPDAPTFINLHIPSGLLAVGVINGDAYLWNIITGEIVDILTQPNEITGIAFAGTEKTVITLSTDGLIRVWQAQE